MRFLAVMVCVFMLGGCPEVRDYDLHDILGCSEHPERCADASVEGDGGGGDVGTTVEPVGGRTCDSGELSQGCSAGVGQCERAGSYICEDDELVCDAVAGQPTDELCDTGRDEDCDGLIDEAPEGRCCADSDCGAEQLCERPAGDALAAGECVPVSAGDAGGSDAGACDQVDLQTDAANCGVCGARCGPNEVCEAGTCVSKCGNGELDLDVGEQCDPGRDVVGCTACRITESYGELCSTPGDRTLDGLCYNFGLGEDGGASLPMLMPACRADGSCQAVPGAPWGTKCAEGLGICFLDCSTAADCPPGYRCWNEFQCWKFDDDSEP